MRKLTTLLLFTQLSLSAAQSTTDTAKEGLAALPTPDGAVLRWYLPDDVLPTGGFVVQVTDAGSVRSLPVAAPQPFSPALGITQAQYEELKSAYTGRAPDNDAMTARAFVTLGLLARPDLARALGILTTLKGLSPGAHTATVYAVGTSGQTRVGTATFRTGPSPAIPPPGKLTVTGGQPSAQLAWAPSPGGDDSLVVAYNVYRAPEGGAFSRVTSEPVVVSVGEAGQFRDTGLKTDASYRYQVTSVDLFGRESAPSTAVTLTAKENTPLEVPEITEAKSGNRVVTLSWVPDRDARVKSLLVLRGTDPDQLTVVAKLPATATGYEDKDVVGGVGYLYALSPADASGRGSGRGQLASATAQNLTPPTVPQNVTVKSGENALTITWAPSPESDVLGYLVYRSEGSQTPDQEVQLTGSVISKLTFTDSIPQGVQTLYHYRIVAMNFSKVESAPSKPVTAALLDKTAPPVPVLAPTTVASSGITLTWDQASVPDLKGFEVTRAQGNGPATVLGTVSADTRRYTDAGAQPGMVYSYSVVSVDTAGNRSAPADPVLARLPAAKGNALPQAPQATLLPDGKGVKLDWKPDGAAGQYVVYRFLGTQAVQVSDLLSQATFTDPAGQADSRYQVRAVDSSGTLSDPTPVFTPTH